MFEIRIIALEDVINLRHAVLRPHQTIDDCVYESDREETTFHIGAYLNGELVSIASFNKEASEAFESDNQTRLRAMATLPAYRKLGAGRLIVEFAEKILKEQGVSLLWCKGRVNVKAYYHKLGFTEYGDAFDYPPIGLHVLLYKYL